MRHPATALFNRGSATTQPLLLVAGPPREARLSNTGAQLSNGIRGFGATMSPV